MTGPGGPAVQGPRAVTMFEDDKRLARNVFSNDPSPGSPEFHQGHSGTELESVVFSWL